MSSEANSKQSLDEIYHRLRDLIRPYETKFLVRERDHECQLSLVKDLVIGGRQFSEMFFIGIAVRKGYVAYYYMPIYGDEGIRNKIHPDLLNLLKGKSCFHIRKMDDELLQQIDDSIKIGIDGFIKVLLAMNN